MKEADWNQLKDAMLRSESPVGFGEIDPRSMATMATHPSMDTISQLPDDEEAEDPRLRSGVFVISKLIATGGVGEVWEGVHPTLARTIAVKKLRSDVMQQHAGIPENIRWLKRCFRQEALLTGALEHPHIVPIYDLGKDLNGAMALSMKLIRGKSWDLHLMNSFGMPMADFLGKHLPILIDVAQAVAFAHSRGVVHRDLKPSQVMVGEFGEVLLADWGLAMVVDEEVFAAAAPQLASLDIVPTRYTAMSPAGTPAYMAPEQTDEHAENIGTWTDVFLLGGILYYLLTGSPPHTGILRDSLYEKAMACEIVHPLERPNAREIPQELADLAMKALVKDPRRRLQTAGQFVEELQAYLTGASKRRESRQLTRQILDQLPSANGDYNILADCESLLTRALGLWPENPAAEPLRQRVLLEFAQSALENSDLTLARIQAERMADCEEKGEILAEIHALEKLSDLAEEQARETELARRQAEARKEHYHDELRRAREASNRLQSKLSAPIAATLQCIAEERRQKHNRHHSAEIVRQQAMIVRLLDPSLLPDDLTAFLMELLVQQGDQELALELENWKAAQAAT